MRVLGILCVVGVLFAKLAAGAEHQAASLPTCALACMKTSLSQTSCALTDQACLCTDAKYTAYLEKCVSFSCTIRESLATKNVTSSACGAPIRDRTKVVSYAGVAGGIVALIAFILRIIARIKCSTTIGMDDLTMTVTMCLLVTLSALSVVLAEAGLGRDIWTIPTKNITYILYIYFWDELIYLSILPLTKISILCFYLRIFPEPRFRVFTYIAIALNVGYLIAFVLISVFQCRPIAGAWLHWDGEGNYQCNNINAQGWASAIINMVLDIMVMLLPLRQLYKLKLSWKKKAYVMCMFGLGIFVTLVSVLRLNSLIHFASTQNLTWDYVAVGYWSTIECDVGVICACLPAIRSLLRHAAPGVFGDTEQNKSYGTGSHGRGNSRLDGSISVLPKGDKGPFYPLNDFGNSSEARLHQNR
ncbi:hypothetical protein POX_f08366 [Penicillium oxalicum]|uniref:CFEM domain-containing protein n=1 Tax=Penicillium oxalicum (strain 114-2 / CGMCC 5302) TaxID=933388 RepID=S8B481_PENO1|nr:hypothetical protein POX_f08366 [Penicillium oxalicum]EPS29322.1 hypothetical protein PDE_04271 [Penicillium oxalicum 114-2]KAI2787983.1 hypothetical protein POX_f08366 [Penicillium oxalicum]